jgi:hypothetical protein
VAHALAVLPLAVLMLMSPINLDCHALLHVGVHAAIAPALAHADPGYESRPPVPPPPADFDIGFDVRIREVTHHNLLDFDSNQDCGPPSDAHSFRCRVRIWPQLKFRSGLGFYSRFTTEWRKYVDPWTSSRKTEIILGNLYMDIPELPYVPLPLSLRVGRHDIMRGEGFVLYDGGPLDESRSVYQNAILLGLDGENAGLGQTRAELFAIHNPYRDKLILANPPTDEEKHAGIGRMIENDETAFGIYVTNSSIKGKTIETYYIYKEEEQPAARDPHTRLHTIGARGSGDLPWSLDFALEGAFQFGTHDTTESGATTHDHSSFGGYAWLSRSFLALFHPTIELGVIHLSGNDSGSIDDEGWHPLFSRWTKWSELYVHTLIPEGDSPGGPWPRTGRIAYWTNLTSLNAQLALHFSKSLTLSYTYQHLTAPESLGPEPTGRFGDGKHRGDNHRWKISVEMTRALSWHMTVERFAPGDFYNQPHDDAFFVQWELMLKK